MNESALVKMGMMNLVLILLVLLSLLSIIKSDCIPKQFAGKDSFVCVCNENQCDYLPKIKQPSEDEVHSFESDKNKNRFKSKVLKLSANWQDSPEIDLTITINKQSRNQKIIGFGGAFTDATGINIYKLSSRLQDRLIRDYFSENGLQYSMGRVVIGGSDFSDRNYTLDDDEDDMELKKFSLTNDDHLYKIAFIKKAIKLVPALKLFASSWSPPKWMKTNNKINGIGILKGEPGGLYYKLYAQYLVKFLDAYKEEGINFWGLTTANEPTNGLKTNWPFNCIGLSPEMMRDFVKLDLAPLLHQSGYSNLKLMILDDNPNYLELYTQVIMSDLIAAQFVSGIAFHWYAHKWFPYSVLKKVYQQYPDHFLLSTEACEGWLNPLGVRLGNWSRAESYTQDIIETLNHGSSGWIDWNMALDEEGGPNWVSNFVDSPIIITDNNEYYKQPHYYALAHFTKFIKPGSVHVDHRIEAKRKLEHKIRATSLLNSDGNLVVVLLNKNNQSVSIRIKKLHKKSFTITMAANSIRTLISKTLQ